MAVAGLFSLTMTWWSSPIDRVNTNPFAWFDQRGITLLGYAAFAFILGVCAGLVLRRTVPAMVATLVVFGAVRLAVTEWVRPYLFTPLRLVSAFQSPTGNGPAGNGPSVPAAPQAGDLAVSNQVVNAAGGVVGQNGAIGYGCGRYGILVRTGWQRAHGSWKGWAPAPIRSRPRPEVVPDKDPAPRSSKLPRNASAGWGSRTC